MTTPDNSRTLREDFEARYSPYWSPDMFKRSVEQLDDYADNDVDLMWVGYQAATTSAEAKYLPVLEKLVEEAEAMLTAVTFANACELPNGAGEGYLARIPIEFVSELRNAIELAAPLIGRK